MFGMQINFKVINQHGATVGGSKTKEGAEEIASRLRREQPTDFCGNKNTYTIVELLRD